MTVTLEDRGDVARHASFIVNRERLCEIASRAIILHGRTPEDFAVIAIDTRDRRWHPLIKTLMPEVTDETLRDLPKPGVRFFARGSIPRETLEFLCQIMPGISHIKDSNPPKGEVYAFVFGDGGCSVYSVPFAPTMKHRGRPS